MRSLAQECAGDNEEDKVADVEEADILGILKSIGTCPDAYAVVQAEASRKAAVDASAQSGGIEFKSKTISLNTSRVKPPSVQWPKPRQDRPVVRGQAYFRGLGVIRLGLAVSVVASCLCTLGSS